MNQLQRMILSLLFTSFYTLVSSAQYQLSDPIPFDPAVRMGKLSNGLTYYIRHNPKPEKKVELRLVVNTGSVLEEDNQQGLAHFMEHMGFNGLKHFPKNELVNFLQKTGVKFGADLNAYTSFDETVYILPVSTEDPVVVEKSFTILEDWAFNNLLDLNEIEKERGVVLEESRLRKGAFERMSRQYFPRLFNGSKYATRLPIGDEEVLKTFKPETLKKFYTDWYRPELMAVIVVGDLDPDVAEKKIRDHFEKYKNPKSAPVRPEVIPIANRDKAEAMVLTDEEATNAFVQIYNFVKPAPAVKTWAGYRTHIIETLISNLINQRLNELTQKENAPFIFANTGYSPFLRGYNSFNSFAVLGKASAQDAVLALADETNRARQYGFLAAEIERAKSEMLNDAETAVKEKNKSESSMLIWEYVNHYLAKSPVPGVEHKLNFLKAVLPTITVAEINKEAASMPSMANAFALIQAPAGMKNELPDNDALLKTIVTASSRKVTAYEETEVGTSLLDQIPVPGKIISESKNEKLGVTDFTLSNGITIRVKPTTLKNDQILMDAWRWGGTNKYLAEDKENAVMATMMVSQMGFGKLNPVDQRKFMAGKTVDAHPYMNPNEEGVEGSSSVKDFETFLQLCYLIFTQPRKDEKLFNTFLTSQKAALIFVSKNPEISFQDTLQKIMYDNHPWVMGIPTPADIDKLKLDKILNIYNNAFSNAYGMHFTFVGNLDPQAAKPLFEKYLGSLPTSKKENTYNDVGLRMIKGKTEVIMKRGKEPKAQINLRFEGETEYNRNNRLHLAALLEVLNIRIIEKLREDMSGMYGGGLFGSIQKRPYEHYNISATIPCGPENVEKLSKALFDIIKEARDKGIEQKDLDKVKENWKKKYDTDLQSNDYWLSTLSNAYINQDNPENILNYKEKIETITTRDLQAAAKKYLNMDNMVYAVMYPEKYDVKEEVKKTKKGF